MSALILDLHEAASAIEADFSHLWNPQDPRTWYRPGALEPVIHPGGTPFYVKTNGEFVLILDLAALPDADIYQGGRGLVVPRNLVPSLTNNSTAPLRGLKLVILIALYEVWRWQKEPGFTLTNPRDWYVAQLMNPEVLRIENLPPCEYDNVRDIFWEAQNNHWLQVTNYCHEVEARIREFVTTHPWCSYEDEMVHSELIVRRGSDRRIEFYERFHSFKDELALLEAKRYNEEEITHG